MPSSPERPETPVRPVSPVAAESIEVSDPFLPNNLQFRGLSLCFSSGSAYFTSDLGFSLYVYGSLMYNDYIEGGLYS